MYKNNNIGMKIKIQKNKWCGMRKLIKIKNPGGSASVGIYEIIRL
jgi:hypothetical protein